MHKIGIISEEKEAGTRYKTSIESNISVSKFAGNPIKGIDLELNTIVYRDPLGLATDIVKTEDGFKEVLPATQVLYGLNHLYNCKNGKSFSGQRRLGNVFVESESDNGTIRTNPSDFIHQVQNQIGQRLSFLQTKGLELTITIAELGLSKVRVNESIIDELKSPYFTQEIVYLSPIN